MPVIRFYIGHDILPWDHDYQVQIEPPDQQERKIKPSDASRVFVPGNVGAQGERGHQGDDVQEKNDVSGEEVRYVSAQNDFVVGPKQLINEPERNAEGDERPE